MGLDMLDLRWEERGGRLSALLLTWGVRLSALLRSGVDFVELCTFGDVPIVWALDPVSGSYREERAHIQGGVVGRAHQRLGVPGPAMRSARLGVRFVVCCAEDDVALRGTWLAALVVAYQRFSCAVVSYWAVSPFL